MTGSAVVARRSCLISGATGFIGRAVQAELVSRGHDVRTLSRRPGENSVVWDPGAPALDPVLVAPFDTVIHLAGESVAGRWTERKRKAIRESRVHGTQILAEACARASERPHTLIAASAIGYYGDRGEEVLTEESAPGGNFLAEVTRGWEEATRPAEEAGIRVVKLRIGVVLGPGGGALAKMLPAFRAGVGGRLGNGRQWMSWIALQDLTRLIVRAAEDPAMSGAYNAVAPEPVRNADFTDALGAVLRRPTLLPVPAFALRLIFKEMADEALLTSQRVVPRRLEQEEFRFEMPDLHQALQASLK